jgi:hypothetical protein
MKTSIGARRITVALVVLAVLLGTPPGHAGPASSAGGGRGGGSGSQGGWGGGHGGRSGQFHGNHGNSRHFHGGHFHGRHFGGSGVFLGVTPWWYAPYWHYPSSYWYYPPPYVYGPPEPPAYVERPAYWYYCQAPPGYYPYVSQCPTQWLKVAPQPIR